MIDLNHLLPKMPAGATTRLVRLARRWMLPLSLLLGVLACQLLTLLTRLPAFILPTPMLVAQRFVTALRDGSLLYHGAATLLEVALGLGIGSALATVIGYLLARSRVLDALLSPYLVASQAIPIVANAPLRVIWFGPGMFSKVLICSLTVFFPVLVNTVVGLRAVPERLRALMQSLHASRWQTLRYLEAPSALPVFLGGLRVGATLSVIGAVVGELVGSDRGLGFLVNVARGQFDTALVFVAVITLILMALGMYGLVVLLEKRLLAWQTREETEEEW